MTSMVINENIQHSLLIIVNLFKDSDIIAQAPKLREHFKGVRYVASRKEALDLCKKIKPSNLFIDSDIGLVPLLRFAQLKFFSKKTSIIIYEEGIGTYRQDLFPNPIKKTLYKIIGAATYFGESKLTKYIYVYDIEKYKEKFPASQKKAVKIGHTLIEWIKKNESDIIEIFSPDFAIDPNDKKSDINIYLSNWILDEKIIKKLSENSKLYIKPHPHIKKSTERALSLNKNIHLFPAQIPAEIIIIKASTSFRKVFIYHHNSSALHYIKLNNVIPIDTASLALDRST